LRFFFEAEDGIRGRNVTGVQTCALPISSKLANDINSFAATVPELSASSELSLQSMPNYRPDESGNVDSDQVIFVNNNSKDPHKGNTSYADSNYRLMNRTINNRSEEHTSDLQS